MKYKITIAVNGLYTTKIDANSEDEAYEEALDEAYSCVDLHDISMELNEPIKVIKS